MTTAANAMSPPSKAADMNSIFPCPYGWLRSAGRPANTRPPRAKRAATTLTIVSSASERMAVEPVRRYAAYFAPSSTTDTASEISPARRRIRSSSVIGTSDSIAWMIPPASRGAIPAPERRGARPATILPVDRLWGDLGAPALQDGSEQRRQEHGAGRAEDDEPRPPECDHLRLRQREQH